MRQVVVVGTGYAGMLAATRLARRTRGTAKVTLVGESELFVERVRLHQQAATGKSVSHAVAPVIEGAGGAFVRARAEGVDLAKRELRLRGREALPFDALVVATGSRAMRDVEGSRQHAFALDAGEVLALRERAKEVFARGGAMVLCGAGLTGVEAAAEFAEAYPGAKITLISDGAIGRGLGENTQRAVRRVLEGLGVTLEEGLAVKAFERGRVQCEGRSFDADVAVFTGGMEASPFARDAGLAVDARGRVAVDAALQLEGASGVFFVGDASVVRADAGPVVMSCKFAMPMAAHAANNITERFFKGKPLEAFTAADTIACISLGRRDAAMEWRTPEAAPTGRVTTGWRAVLVKETICRMIAAVPKMERRGLSLYTWARPPMAAALPQGASA